MKGKRGGRGSIKAACKSGKKTPCRHTREGGGLFPIRNDVPVEDQNLRVPKGGKKQH